MYGHATFAHRATPCTSPTNACRCRSTRRGATTLHSSAAGKEGLRPQLRRATDRERDFDLAQARQIRQAGGPRWTAGEAAATRDGNMTSRQNDIERDVATHAERHLRDCFDVDVVAITMVDADGRSGADRLTRAMAFRVGR